jgi:hypothetical protein
MPADSAPGGPETHQPAPGGGPTHGTSRILTQGGGTHEGGGGPSGTAAGTAGESLQVPGVTRGVERVGLTGGAELGHIELAQENGPRRFQLGDHRGVFIGNKIVENGRAAGGTDARRVELVFDRHRNAV